MKKIAIIGGGIIGAVAAYYLTKEGQTVFLYDEGIGQATKASAGIISPWLSKRRNKQWYALAKDGAAFYEKLVQDLTLDTTIYHKTGALFIRPQAQLDALAQLAATRKQQAPEIGDIELWSAQQTETRFPLLRAQSSLFISGGAKLNGQALLTRLYEQIERQNGTIIRKKVQLTKKEHHFLLTTPTDTQLVDEVVLTSGPHLPSLLEPLGYSIDIRPQKGQLIAFQTKLKTDELPVAILDGEADLIPLANGKILLGATHENEAKWDLTATTEAYTQLTESISRFLHYPERLFENTYHYQIGTRAYTSDFSPFFGQVEPRLFVASGLGSSGLTTGPLIGYLLSKLVLGQSCNLEQYQKPLTTYINPS